MSLQSACNKLGLLLTSIEYGKAKLPYEKRDFLEFEASDY